MLVTRGVVSVHPPGELLHRGQVGAMFVHPDRSLFHQRAGPGHRHPQIGRCAGGAIGGGDGRVLVPQPGHLDHPGEEGVRTREDLARVVGVSPERHPLRGIVVVVLRQTGWGSEGGIAPPAGPRPCWARTG